MVDELTMGLLASAESGGGFNGRRSALAALQRVEHERVWLAADRPRALFDVQGIEADRLRASPAARTPLWTGPRRCMIVADTCTAEALAADLASLPETAMVTDVSHAWVRLTVGGPGARDLLRSGISVELEPEAWPVGYAAQTAYRDIQVLLHATEPECFHLYTFRSLGLSLWQWLDDAAMTV